MGKHIAGLTAVTVMHAAGDVSRPENSEVRGAAVLSEVCTTQVEVGRTFLDSRRSILKCLRHF